MMEDRIIDHTQLTTIPTLEQKSSRNANTEEHQCPTEQKHKHKPLKNSAKYVIDSNKNTPRAFDNKPIKSHRVNAVVPYRDNESLNISGDWDEEHKLVYAETFREKPHEKFNQIITHSKTTRDHNEQATPRAVRINKCGKCKKLSYIENDICSNCKGHTKQSSYLKSFARASAFCCCWFCT